MKILTTTFCILLIISGSFPVKAMPPDNLPPYALKKDTTDAVLFGTGVISTRDDEFGGIFTDDGTTCFFSKSVPRFYLETICESEFKNGEWNTPQIAPFSGQYRSFDPTISPDGKTILFASDRPVNGEK